MAASAVSTAYVFRTARLAHQNGEDDNEYQEKYYSGSAAARTAGNFLM